MMTFLLIMQTVTGSEICVCQANTVCQNWCSINNRSVISFPFRSQNAFSKQEAQLVYAYFAYYCPSVLIY